MSSTSDIQAKYQALKDKGLDLGTKVGSEEAAGFSGQVQRYEHGRIYWHPQVGTFEVHGGILDHYLAGGGPGFAPGGGPRHYGFPIQDESRTEDDRFPVSRFQWGAIYWVSGAGAVGVWGDFYTEYQRLGKATSALGCPVIEPAPAQNGEAVYFERGCMWQGAASGGRVLTCTLAVMYLGRPTLINPANNDERVLPAFASWQNLDRGVLSQVEQGSPAVFSMLWDAKLFLERVTAPGQPAEAIPLLIQRVRYLEPANSNAVRPVADMAIAGHGPADLREGGLYNVDMRLPGGRQLQIMPHGLYAKSNWDSFWLVHATDLHVSRRSEAMGPKLREAAVTNEDLEAAAKAFVNYNDGLRQLIVYANHLHDTGKLDAIMFTGDLVDYIYDHGEKQGCTGGNYVLLERILRGQAPSPTPDVESPELRVPVFTVLGNHDVRPNPYEILFTIGVPGARDHPIDQSGDYNLTTGEMSAFQGGTPTYSIVTHAGMLYDMIETDGWNERHCLDYYLSHFNDKRDYLVRLGRNRLVMVDTGPDTGLPRGTSAEDLLEYIENYLGGDPATRKDIGAGLGGSPNSFGYTAEAFDLLRTAEREARDGGVIIVGQHAPPFHLVNSEHPHYFLESERARTTNFDEVYAFLVRHTDPDVWLTAAVCAADPGCKSWSSEIQQVERAAVRQKVLDFVNGRCESPLGAAVWDAIKAAIDHKWLGPSYPRWPSRFFHAGSTDQLLDRAIARQYNQPFLDLCLGLSEPGGSRPVDLVLCGHAHQWIESRILHRSSDGLMDFYTDYYSENPTYYYPSIYMGVLGPVYPRVYPTATTGEKPAPVRDHRVDPPLVYATIKVPPCLDTLNASSDAAGWWKRHRPLVMETASLGPADTRKRGPAPNPAFQGFRVIRVKNNVIDEMHYVTLRDLRERGVMAWEGPVKHVGGLAHEPA